MPVNASVFIVRSSFKSLHLLTIDVRLVLVLRVNKILKFFRIVLTRFPGLILALTLLRNGISVRIIEKQESFQQGTRGYGMQVSLPLLLLCIRSNVPLA